MFLTANWKTHEQARKHCLKKTACVVHVIQNTLKALGLPIKVEPWVINIDIRINTSITVAYGVGKHSLKACFCGTATS